MNRLILSSGIAVAMIFVALGVAQGIIDPQFGETMLIAMPAFAVATLHQGKCCKTLKGAFS